MTREGTTGDLAAIVGRALRACASPASLAGKTDAEALELPFSDLGFDSLAFMEFCIAIHLDTGRELDVATVVEFGSPRAVLQHISGGTEVVPGDAAQPAKRP